MHPFSLNKEEQQSVNGGLTPELKPIDITQALYETGGPITTALGEGGEVVTMAIPEDGNDPYPFPFDVM